ncbi:MAG: hypothetical protein HOA24_02820 [Candidatus Pacebacteria bacterium]|nr:hypothetical protein [Candidatus Paceibacterota bacterium]MBT3512031.1 hypothetical protein [Candidatus Paceibacterota bacterium]MBT4004883.1 hypothetical protein [Candidatus Paceibacterota bacterium]MBT4359062.1 hypothetical protein [Candidatus Paceibacterota bacterium]MBT4680549.1 hypothetical protein [Candidatus Paceibacterota bacterium]
MSWFAGLIPNTNFLFRKLKINLSLDFGSSQTRLMVNHKLVWDQPTVIAWHTGLQVVVAVGNKAAALRGKTPAYIKLINPIQRGVVAELDYAVYYLRAVLDELQQQKKISPWLLAYCGTALPVNASPLEKEQMRQVLERVGFKVKKIVSKTEVVASLPSFKKITQSHGVIDFGAETVDVGIFIGQQLLKGFNINGVVGNTFTQTIIDQVLTEYELQISWGVAQQIKHQLSTSSMMTVRGKDAQLGLVKVTRVEAKIFEQHFISLMESLLSELNIVINELPPEVMTQLQEQGFYLTGNGSQLLGWQDLIKKNLQMPVIISTSPALDVVKGLDYGE